MQAREEGERPLLYSRYSRYSALFLSLSPFIPIYPHPYPHPYRISTASIQYLRVDLVRNRTGVRNSTASNPANKPAIWSINRCSIHTTYNNGMMILPVRLAPGTSFCIPSQFLRWMLRDGGNVHCKPNGRGHGSRDRLRCTVTCYIGAAKQSLGFTRDHSEEKSVGEIVFLRTPSLQGDLILALDWVRL